MHLWADSREKMKKQYWILILLILVGIGFLDYRSPRADKKFTEMYKEMAANLSPGRPKAEIEKILRDRKYRYSGVRAENSIFAISEDFRVSLFIIENINIELFFNENDILVSNKMKVVLTGP